MNFNLTNYRATMGGLAKYFKAPLLGVMIILTLTGCSFKERHNFIAELEKHKESHKMLQRTESSDLMQDGKLHGLFLANYLYSPTLKREEFPNDVFIIALQFDDEREVTLNNVKKSITLVGKRALTEEEKELLEEQDIERHDENITALSVKRLTEQEVKAQYLSFISPWSHYFEMQFPHMQSDRLTLKFDDASHEKAQLVFRRKFKYTYSKKAFR